MDEFFAFWAHLLKPSELAREFDCFFFRADEVPMWEESPKGGLWILKVKKDDNIDRMWETLLFSAVGEQFESREVIGVSL